MILLSVKYLFATMFEPNSVQKLILHSVCLPVAAKCKGSEIYSVVDFNVVKCRGAFEHN